MAGWGQIDKVNQNRVKMTRRTLIKFTDFYKTPETNYYTRRQRQIIIQDARDKLLYKTPETNYYTRRQR